MTASELFDDGRLSDAVETQRMVVQHRPDDASSRLLLCELLAFGGRFNEVVEELSRFPNADAAMQGYLADWRELMQADVARHSGRPAEFLTEPGGFELFVSANRATDEDALEMALQELPMMEGHVDGRAFEGCRDSDDAVAGGLEFFAGGSSYLAPWDQLRKWRMAPVENLRDRLYRPATLTLADGRAVDGFVPTKYATGPDTPEELLCGLGTDYRQDTYCVRGVGAKTLMVGEEELTLLEFTQLELRPVK